MWFTRLKHGSRLLDGQCWLEQLSPLSINKKLCLPIFCLDEQNCLIYWNATMSKLIGAARMFPLIICCSILMGCAAHSRDAQKLPASTYAIGRDNERLGIISSADYIRWQEVANKIDLHRRIDDEDLDWAISAMQKPSTRPSELHERIMSLFRDVWAYGPGQQEKVRAAVTPLLTSRDPFEVKYAKSVLSGPHRPTH